MWVSGLFRSGLPSSGAKLGAHQVPTGVLLSVSLHCLPRQGAGQTATSCICLPRPEAASISETRLPSLPVSLPPTLKCGGVQTPEPDRHRPNSTAALSGCSARASVSPAREQGPSHLPALKGRCGQDALPTTRRWPRSCWPLPPGGGKRGPPGSRRAGGPEPTQPSRAQGRTHGEHFQQSPVETRVPTQRSDLCWFTGRSPCWQLKP